MLRCWATVVEGIFEIERHDGDTAVMVNLVDELTHRVRSNAGPQPLPGVTPLSNRQLAFLRPRTSEEGSG